MELFRPQTPPFALPVRANRYYLPVSLVAGTSTSAVVANTVFYLPHYLPGATVNRIGIEVTTGAAGAARLGFYADDGAGLPGALILDAGTVDTTSNANVEASFTARTLPNGIVWAAVVFDATPTCRNGTAANSFLLGLATPSATQRGYQATLTYGALPATASLASLGSSGIAPAVWFRSV
jgi:hypothetical protein